jgi:feruloyl esterase
MMGGGGFDGTIPNVIGDIPNTTPTALTPLGLGFAVFGSDSGHQSSADLSATGLDASFALNQEALMNWVGDALKKTHDAALLVVAAAYGSSPSQSYFVGASTGGREALAVASRWPADWDGVVSLYPARDATTILGLINMSEAFAAPGAYLDSAKRGVLYSAALAACDALDGVSDGVISNVQGCNAIFNPATATLNGIPVQCPGGTDTGDTCLSAAQLSALDTVNSPISFGFSLATGETGFPGFNAYISDAGIPSTSPYESYVSLLGFGFAPPAFPVTASMALSAGFSDQFVRYIVAGNAGFDYLTFNATNPGAYASRVSEFAGWLDDTDLTAFAAKGGKLLLMHGTADMLISPRASELYYQRLQANMGADNVNTFLRFYEVPGFAHELSTTFNVAWDSLTALENWVEQGIDPASNQVVIDTLGVPGRTRPLCIYPTWPKYSGSGDVNSAASFTCAQY